MMDSIAVIGGGLAGLALSIDLKKRGYPVVLIEKGNYPRHKVCGEYISMESHGYLQTICPALQQLNLPRIHNIKLSSTWNAEVNTTLHPGGFGISRYLLEDLLFTEAKRQGVVFMLNSKALDIHFDPAKQTYAIKTTTAQLTASLVCNSTGRKSNLETKESTRHRMATNYVGVKYHVKLHRDPSTIEIHNFPGGYCGISGIEDGNTCLCYLVNSKNLNSVHNSIPALEKHFLYRNSRLKKIFTTAHFIFKDPLTVSGINFLIKKTATDSSFYLGDAAGSIAPVTGNGMSIGLRSACVLADTIHQYYTNTLTRRQLADTYTGFWNKEFSTRIKLSRHIQKLSEYSVLANLTIGIFNSFPSLAKGVIRQTHGNPF
jgi:menaquinone-9 beta-reductase